MFKRLMSGAYVNIASIFQRVENSLTSESTTTPISANQGKILNETKQDDLLTQIAGTANQVLIRDNETGNTLKFATIPDASVYEEWAITPEDTGITVNKNVVLQR